MAEWRLDKRDKEIVFLIKTMKKQYLESTLKEGTLCFNCPTLFNTSPQLAPAQFDQWDSHLSSKVRHVMYAPIISEDVNGFVYGTPKKLADSASLRMISSASKKTPLCSFRKVEETDFVSKYGAFFLKLGSVVDRVKNEFNHDAFILVCQPKALLQRISSVTSCFARSIHYGDINKEFQDFLDSTAFVQKEMFQKDHAYAWQKEFRIVLPANNDSSMKIIKVGSIEDIAFGGDIEMLRQGYIFGENEEKIKNAIQRMNARAYL